MLQNDKKALSRWKTSGYALIALAMILLTACGGNDNGNEANGESKVAGDADKIIAEYDGGDVNEQEFNRYYYTDKYFYETLHNYYEQGDPAGFKEQMLQSYISFKILSDRADDEIKQATESEVEQRMEMFDSELSSNEDLRTLWEAKSSQWGIGKDDVERYISVQAAALNHVRSMVTEDKVQAMYEQALELDPNAYTTATVRHVLVMFEPADGEARTDEEALERALEVKELLEGGEDFGQVAKEYSEDDGSKNNGGRYVSALINEWVEPFKEAALELPLNTISDPVKTEYGYHVMLVEDRREQPFEEVQTLLQGQAVNEIYANFMNEELPELIKKLELPSEQ